MTILYFQNHQVTSLHFYYFWEMRKLFPLVFIFTSLLLCNCVMPSQDKNEKIIAAPSPLVQRDTFHLLCQFWQLSDADNPTQKDISFTNNDGVLFQSGIVFMTDSSVLENPTGEMSYGKFRLKGNTIYVDFDNGTKAVYLINMLHKGELKLKRSENKRTSELSYKATNTSWPDANKNPFSKQNYQWSSKPKKSESDEEIRKRVKESVQFYAYYFTGYVNGGATNIDFNALPGCLNWYQGGITIQNENKLDKKWISCFYSRDQAEKGRQMLEDAVLKKYNWDAKETNWMKQIVPVLQQIYNNL